MAHRYIPTSLGQYLDVWGLCSGVSPIPKLPLIGPAAWVAHAIAAVNLSFKLTFALPGVKQIG